MAKKTVIKLRQLLKEKKKGVVWLADTVECRPTTLSRWQRHSLESINLELLAKVYDALELNDLKELIDVVDVDEEMKPPTE